MEDALGARKDKVFSYLKKKPLVLIYFILAGILSYGAYIRTRNLEWLIDVTTGKYIPIALDPFVFLRYVRTIIETGSLMAVDTMRYFPIGYTGMNEFKIMSYAIVYLYKFWSFFDPSVTVEYVHVIYPVVAFILGTVFFFLLMKKVFNWKVALLSTSFLAVLPAYLYRTMAGFSDKEAFAVMLIYLGFFLFVSFFKEKNFKKAIAYSVGAGVAVAGAMLVWGGGAFIVLTIGMFMILMVLLNKVDKKILGLYSLFILCFYITYRIFFPERAIIESLLTSYLTGIIFLALFFALINYFLFTKDLLKIKSKIKIPHSFASLLILVVLAFVGLLIFEGPSFFVDKLSFFYTLLTAPQTFDRWALTVAESHQPYFTDILGYFGWWYLALVLSGGVLMFYETFKSFGKDAYYLSAAFGVFIVAFMLSRYSSSSALLNGSSGLAIVLYLGSLIGFIGYLGYVIYEKYKVDEKVFSKINLGYLMVIIFFMFTLVGARSAVRLLFIFAPGTAMLAGFGVFILAIYSWKFKDKIVKYGGVILLLFLVIFLLNGFAESSLAQAQYTAPSYNNQWQLGMNWVRENTAEDSVFAHWWDYGYWVQTGGERATLSDGGNARGAINHFIGRHLLTGHSETEALELLAANEATHVLMISDEIGKYGAYSSIGADAGYDRYSYIPSFSLDDSQSFETRNGTTLVYTGGMYLEDDFIYGDILYPASSAAVAGVMVPVELDENNNVVGVSEQPTAALILNGQYSYIPLKCIFLNGEEITYEGDGLDACLQIIPSMNSGNYNLVGMGLFLSPRVYPTTFTHLYLFGEDWDYFDLVYEDSAGYPLMYYEGRIIGPLKIWEVSYPDDLNIPEEYYGTEIPEEVTKV